MDATLYDPMRRRWPHVHADRLRAQEGIGGGMALRTRGFYAYLSRYVWPDASAEGARLRDLWRRYLPGIEGPRGTLP